MSDDLLRVAFERIDAANAEDPNLEQVDGVATPKELVYSRRMTQALDAYRPAAGAALRLAARAQHLRRWTLPRSDYPMNKAGYHAWRNEQKRRHANDATAILREVGYDDAIQLRVSELLQKKRLRTDPEVQTLEDVICLVFLEHYLDGFMAKHPRPKVIDIIAKTWAKMSAEGQAAALELPLGDTQRALVEAALAHDG